MKKTVLIVFILMCSACFPPDEIVLTDEEKKARIETLAKEQIEQVKKEIEANCEQIFERNVARAVDSLVAVYLDSTEFK